MLGKINEMEDLLNIVEDYSCNYLDNHKHLFEPVLTIIKTMAKLYVEGLDQPLSTRNGVKNYLKMVKIIEGENIFRSEFLSA